MVGNKGDASVERKMTDPVKEVLLIASGGILTGLVFNIILHSGVFSPGGILGGLLSGLLIYWLT